MNEAIMIAGMALVTFSIRYLLLAAAGRITFPNWARDALAFVPPAVLTAIIVPAVLIPNGAGIELSWRNPYLLAALITLAVGLVRKHLLTTIVVGMASFVVLRFLVL